MQYTTTYQSPLGEILLAADTVGLTGLWFEGEKYYALSLDPEHLEKEIPVFHQVKRWLDIYFSGQQPDFMAVWETLREIPYGQTTTYGAIARKIARQRGLSKMSAQAVGQAVGRNELSILVPCHRVVGTNGSLTGYAGGIDKKIQLLQLEGAFREEYFVPKYSTAP